VSIFRTIANVSIVSGQIANMSLVIGQIRRTGAANADAMVEVENSEVNHKQSFQLVGVAMF